MLPNLSRYITVREAAKRLGVSRQWLYVLLYQGRLDAHYVADRWLINGDNLTIKPPQWREKKD